MKTALIISSTVAASRVGAQVSTFCLNSLGHETVTVPTVLLGRHPGWGTPGGGPVETETFQDILNTALNQPIRYDAILTGYMANSEQIDLTVKAISHIRENNPNVIVCVDPIMGDQGQLYIPKDVADHLVDSLVPCADILTPNLWELGYITGQPEDTPLDTIQNLAKTLIVTSYPSPNGLGALLCHDEKRYVMHHSHLTPIPNGSGDCLAALYLAKCLEGTTEHRSFRHAVSATFEILSSANHYNDRELPLVRERQSLISPTLLNIDEDLT